jgi:hypothetical protein
MDEQLRAQLEILADKLEAEEGLVSGQKVARVLRALLDVPPAVASVEGEDGMRVTPAPQPAQGE